MAYKPCQIYSEAIRFVVQDLVHYCHLFLGGSPLFNKYTSGPFTGTIHLLPHLQKCYHIPLNLQTLQNNIR
jgi:hypothetical protein